MNTLIIRAGMLILCFSMLAVNAQGQGRFIRKMKEKTEQKIVNEIFNEEEEKNTPSEETESTDRLHGQNRKGTGLEAEAPDVKKNIADAGNAFDAKKYIEAKAAVRNALWGVELEIGHKVLDALPLNVEGLKHLESEDQVSSAGAGFVGLIIERLYQGDNEMQLKTTIGNDSALLGLAGLYMTDGMYEQNSDQPNQKQIRFQDHKAVIQYTDYEGYTLSVPFGQSSVFLINGINFENESQFMAAANNFDINKIKKELGDEQ